jgi:hypothetical protein
MRGFPIVVGWWLAISIWFALDFESGSLRFDHFTLLETTLVFSYTAIPLSAGFLTGLVALYGFRLGGWWRAILSGLICGGVVLMFFVATEQLDFGDTAWIAVFTLAGASIGLATRRVYQETTIPDGRSHV